MALWFVGTAIVTIWFVFRDPWFDYRLLIIGSLLPELDALWGGARVMHTLLFSVVVLVGVMLVTVGRRPVRRLMLGVPIGTLLHLVFDGVWTDTSVFWWPATGWRFDDAPLPAAERGWWGVLLELVGAALLAWVWRAAGLADPARRRAFAHHGCLAATAR